MKRKKGKLTREFWERDAEAWRELERRVAELDARLKAAAESEAEQRRRP